MPEILQPSEKPVPMMSSSRPNSSPTRLRPRFEIGPLVKSMQRGLIIALATVGATAALASSAIAQALLQLGSQGPAVERLQTQLAAERFYDGAITGFYGERTQNAVIRFQNARGLTPDGIVGPRTEVALYGISTFAPTPPPPNPVIPTPIDREPPISGGFPPQVDPVVDTAQLPDPTTASCASFISSDGLSTVGTLQRGDIGSSVRILQEELDDLGFNPGGIDGIFGANTERAVIEFQQSRGIRADGVVGPETARLLGLALTGDDQPIINTGPYAVVVPAELEDLEALGAARREVPRACFARSRLGTYIYAGGYPSRSLAEDISLRLRSRDLDSRVDFRRRIRVN